MGMPAAVQTAVSAFNASTGGVKNIGLAPNTFQNGKITFADKGTVLHSLSPIIELNRDYGCDCYRAKDLDAGPVLNDEVKRIGGIFERRLAEFLPEKDTRSIGDKGMRERAWDDTREMTLKDLFASLRTARTINLFHPGGAINSSGYQFIAESILGQALTDGRGHRISDPSLRQVAAYIDRMKGKDGTDKAADCIIASAVLYSMVTSTVGEALRNSSLMSGAAELYAGLKRPHMSAMLYELALDMMPSWRSMDEEERWFKNELHSAAARQWLATRSPDRSAPYAYIYHVFRAMQHAWDGGDLEALSKSHEEHSSWCLDQANPEWRSEKRFCPAAHAKFRQGLTEIERLERNNWDLGGNDLNRAAEEKIVKIFEEGDWLLSHLTGGIAVSS